MSQQQREGWLIETKNCEIKYHYLRIYVLIDSMRIYVRFCKATPNSVTATTPPFVLINSSGCATVTTPVSG